MLEDLFQIIDIPTRQLAGAFDPLFGVIVLDEGVRQLSEGREIFGTVPDPQLMAVFSKDHIQNPMQLIFHFPVVPDTA